MQPHPDFAKVDLPRSIDLGVCRLSPLIAEHAEEDFEAVMSSGSVLRGVFGDWPAGLTLEENRIDLAWHDREFTTRRSFSWIIRDASAGYLGCLYLFPDIGHRGSAEGVIWFRDMPNRDETAAAIAPTLRRWMKKQSPSGVQIAWRQSP